MATPRPDEWANYTASAARYSVGMEIDGDLFAYAAKKEASYLGDILKRKTKSVRDTAAHLIAIRAFMNGDGIMAQVTGVAGNVLTLGSPGANWFRRGQRVIVPDLTTGGTDQLTGAAATRGKVVGVDRINNAITLADATGAAVGDYVALENMYDITEMQGLKSLIKATGTVQGVLRTTAGNDFAQAWVLNLGGAALTEMNGIQKLNDYIRDYSPNQTSVSEFITDSASARAVFLSVADRIRYLEAKEIVPGFKSIQIMTAEGPVPLSTDPYCYNGDVYGLNLGEAVLMWPEGEKGGTWFDRNGNVLHPKTGSTAGGVYADAWQGWWVMRPQLAIDDFQAQGLLTNFVSL
jgi:hypothetical protein